MDILVVLLTDDCGETEVTDDTIDVGDEDALMSPEELVCVRWRPVVGAAEGAADPFVGEGTGLAVAVSV